VNRASILVLSLHDSHLHALKWGTIWQLPVRFHGEKKNLIELICIFINIQHFSILMIQVSLNRIEIFHYTRGYKNSGSDNIGTTYHPSCLLKRGYPTLKNRRKNIMKQFQPSTTVNTHVQRPSIAAFNGIDY
jgi:hypothetical protein